MIWELRDIAQKNKKSLQVASWVLSVSYISNNYHLRQWKMIYWKITQSPPSPQTAKKAFPSSPWDSILWGRNVASDNLERFASTKFSPLGLSELNNSANFRSPYSKNPHYIKDLL